MNALLYLAALLHLLPPMPQPMRGCVSNRREAIAAEAQTAADAHGVPVAVLLVVGLLESRYGCDPRSGGSWGAPIDPQHRHTAGGPGHAARALASGYRVCGSTLGAVSRFRCGLCTCRRVVGYTATYAAGLIARVEAFDGGGRP